MRRSRFTEEQILTALRQAEGGTPVTDIRLKLGIPEGTSYSWKKQFGGLGVSELSELRERREETRKLRQLVATSASTNGFSSSRCESMVTPTRAAGVGRLGAGGVSALDPGGLPRDRGPAVPAHLSSPESAADDVARPVE